MSTTRHFNASREIGKKSISREIMEIEKQKKGKLDQAARFKIILKRKQEESRAKLDAENAAKDLKNGGKGGMFAKRKVSARAQQALKEIAMKKAAKEAKKQRKAVIVEPRQFPNGSITKNGRIYDIAGNIVAQVNLKDGRITTYTGWFICKYKPKSYMTNVMIQEAINKHSPYFIQLRKMQLMQQGMSNVYGGYQDPNAANVHGMSAMAAMHGAGYAPGEVNIHGVAVDSHASGANVTMTAWGAMSNNTWGTFSNNAWGTVADNVHGTVNADVWGAAGAGSGMWGQRGTRLYGTGSGENMLSGLTKYILGLFGYQSKSAREAQRQARAMRVASGSGGAAAAAPRRR